MPETFHRLSRYLLESHWDGAALVGPDPGVRLNYRVGRFVKSYLSAIRWDDDLYYLQAQGYWTLATWRLFDLTQDERYRDVAVSCSERMLKEQRDDGAWAYPNREWAGRVATVEGVFASLGLIETYRHIGGAECWEAVERWRQFLEENIGFQVQGGEVSVNYFAGRTGLRVVNNSVLLLRLIAEEYAVAGDSARLERGRGLLNFVRAAQKPTGELPYGVEGEGAAAARPHFQCYQYNAFQCLDLLRYFEITKDPAALSILDSLVRFLRTGVSADGHAQFDCGNRHESVTYHAAALGAALAKAGPLTALDCQRETDRALGHVRGLQRADGSFPHSTRNYRLLSDRRSYPRYLAMMLYLLLETHAGKSASLEQEGAPIDRDASTEYSVAAARMTGVEA
jgi:hypothetical protein